MWEDSCGKLNKQTQIISDPNRAFAENHFTVTRNWRFIRNQQEVAVPDVNVTNNQTSEEDAAACSE